MPIFHSNFSNVIIWQITCLTILSFLAQSLVNLSGIVSHLPVNTRSYNSLKIKRVGNSVVLSILYQSCSWELFLFLSMKMHGRCYKKYYTIQTVKGLFRYGNDAVDGWLWWKLSSLSCLVQYANLNILYSSTRYRSSIIG